MLATKYDELDVTANEWRVLHRIGARDPVGIKRAMKKYNVDNIPDLVSVLEHHQPQRKTLQRLLTALGRVVGGYGYNPHKQEFTQAFKANDYQDWTIQDRIRKAKQSYDG